MNYVVVVLDPVPSDLSAASDVVAERFRIGHDKASALLARAPGPVTKAVPEAQARTVADILHQAGLRVELRSGDANGPATAYPGPTAGAEAGAYEDAGVPERAPEQAPQGSEPDATAPGAAAPNDGGSDEVTHAYPAEDSVAAGELDEGAVAVADDVPYQEVRSEDRRARPEPGLTTTTPPRDPMKTTLTREPPDLERSGLRRRISTAATLPAILTLLVTLLALAATLLPVLRAQQARRAADTATAVAATIEGLSGGLPLSAPLIRAELRQVEERTRAQLAPRGVAFMAVVDADDTVLLEWNNLGTGEGSLTPEQAATVAAAIDTGRAGGAGLATENETLTDSLGASFRTLLAMVGLAAEEPLLASSEVRRAGAPVGAVVVALDPSGLRAQLGQVLLTTLLVGLIPVLFAVLAALSLTRGIRDAIRYLLVATDRISHGDFERPVELERDDELGQIAGAVERMRVSLRESMERLRRRR